ncbi:MAG: sigma-70 family RNA polymerase sigma factor [Ferruginibacter sp.]
MSDVYMFDEEKTVKQVLNGNVKVFESIVQQYEKLVFSILNRLMDDRQDIEDTGQEVFLKVYNGLSGFKGESKLSTWIGRIAWHTGINYLKKKKRAQYDSLSELPADFHFTEDDPQAKLLHKELNVYINALVDELPLQYKTVVSLYHYNDLSYKEIEAITGYPEGTVKGYLFRARKLLKEKLEQYGSR